MTRRGVALLVVLLLLAGCAWPVTTESPTPTNADGESGSPTAARTPTTAEPASVTTVTPPGETPAATFVVDGDPAAAVTLEVADTREDRRRGLMDRESLPSDHGMLFVFGSEASRSFWMKNTLIPLDIVFLDANLTVLNVEHASPEPNASDPELRRYESDGPAKYVIEVNRGFANETGVEAGTRVEFHGNETLLTPDG